MSITKEQTALINKLRYMGKQYAAGQFARGGGQQKHYLEEAADEIERLAAAQSQPLVEPTAAVRDVLAERQRQIEREGWTPAHDDEHSNGAMATAAACYALTHIQAPLCVNTLNLHSLWQWTGWAAHWFKPKTHRQDLIRAGALIVAEIERLDRAASQHQVKKGEPS